MFKIDIKIIGKNVKFKQKNDPNNFKNTLLIYLKIFFAQMF